MRRVLTYVVAIDEAQYGPYTCGELRELLAAGTILSDSQVRFADDPHWQPLAEILASFEPAHEPRLGSQNIVCPHCHQRGGVCTRKVLRKAGIDGGKVTAALLTDGWSLLATGLAQEDRVTEAKCELCLSTWHVQ